MRKAIIITGASRGFGRAIAASSSKLLTSSCHFVLSGSNEEELRRTEELVVKSRPEGAIITTEVVVADLSHTSRLAAASAALFDHFADSSDFDEIIFYNNAGSLGPLAPIGSEAQSLESMTTAFNINVTATCFLTSELIKR